MVNNREREALPLPGWWLGCGLEQSQDRLGRLGGEAQRCRAQSLSGLEHEHVGALLVHVGVGQPGRTILEDVDHALGELLSGGDDAQVVGQFA